MVTPDRETLGAALRDSEYRRCTDAEFAARVHLVAEVTGRARLSVAETLAVADVLAGPLALPEGDEGEAEQRVRAWLDDLNGPWKPSNSEIIAERGRWLSDVPREGMRSWETTSELRYADLRSLLADLALWRERAFRAFQAAMEDEDDPYDGPCGSCGHSTTVHGDDGCTTHVPATKGLVYCPCELTR